MPLDFSDEEMTLLLALAQPIEPAQRSAWTRWPPRSGSRRAGRASFTRPRGGSRGISGRRRRFRPTRRRPSIAATPPEGLGGRLKGEVQSWNTRGEAAIIGGRASWLSSHGPALVPPNESIDRRGREELGASCVPATLRSKRPEAKPDPARLLRAPETPRMTTHEA
jgi:hypothetical protein